jgi:multiple sugar transport system permease protein
MAASIVGVFPVLIVFVFLQKYIVEGLTAGAVKN